MAVDRSLLLRGGREFGVEGQQLRRGAGGDEGDHGVAGCRWTSENARYIKEKRAFTVAQCRYMTLSDASLAVGWFVC